MITFIVYKESIPYRLSDFLCLYQSFQDNGEVYFLERPKKTSDLLEYIQEVLTQRFSCEWRILYLDCSQVYQCENPYDSLQNDFRYMEEFLELRPSFEERKVGKAVLHFQPEEIFWVTMRCGLYYHTERENYLYSDFANRYRSNYRYLIYDVGIEEPDLSEYLLFEVMCGVLTLALNEWPAAMLEMGVLYQYRLQIEEEKLAEYIGEMEETRRQIEKLVYRERHRHSNKMEYLDDVQNISDSIDSLDSADSMDAEKTILFCKQKFSFAVKENDSELYRWRMKNIPAVRRLEELKKNPVKRWKKEIDKKKSQILPEYGVENFQKKYLTEGGWHDLMNKKQECAEEIFKERILDSEFQRRLEKCEEMEQKMEQKICCRMTKKSFQILLSEILFGFGIIGIAYRMVISVYFYKSLDIAWMVVFFVLIIVILVLMLILYTEREYTFIRLNKSLKELDRCLIKTDMAYHNVLDQIVIHKRYSILEQWQREFMWEERETKRILDEYEQMVLSSEGMIRQFLWIFGKQPVICPDICDKVMIDFSVSPRKNIYFYMPHYKNGYDLIMEESGIRIQVPFYFICHFEIRKLYLPYQYRNEQSGESEMDGQRGLQ